MTTQQALQHIRQTLLPVYGEGESASIANIVLEDAFGFNSSQQYENQPLTTLQADQLVGILARLLAHEPVQYVVGKAYFFGLFFKVTPAVLIPRQETEELVAWVLECTKQQPTARLLDIGTGSGCIPVAIQKKQPAHEVHALDVSADALDIARENAAANHAAVHFHHLDILDETQWQRLPMFDLIVSNPPYIADQERALMPKNVLEHEPYLALFSGSNDPLRFYKGISRFAQQYLHTGGQLFSKPTSSTPMKLPTCCRHMALKMWNSGST